MFIRINTLRINCDTIVRYKPQNEPSRLLINYTNGWNEIKFSTSAEMIKVLKKLDDLFEIKENLASSLPKKED